MKSNKSSGYISRTLIILGVVVIVAILIVFFAIRLASNASRANTVTAPTTEEPVYEATLGDIRFLVESAQDLGSVLPGETSRSFYQPDVITTEKFIKVIIRAQNKGKTNTGKSIWEMGNIVDSDGRNFPPSDQVFYFLPNPDLCGEILKPEFEPVPCVRIYEVSRVSTKLKVQVGATNANSKKQTTFLDLDVK
jgi:hypothetical protein